MPIHGLVGGVNKQFSAHHGLVGGVNKEFQSIYGVGGGVNKEVFSSNVNIASVPTDGTQIMFNPQPINTIEFDFVITYQSGKVQSEHIFYIKMKNTQGSLGSIGLKAKQYYDAEDGGYYEKLLYVQGDRTYTLGDRRELLLSVTNGNVSGIKHHIKYTMLSSGRFNVHVNDVLLISEYSIYDICGISNDLMALSCYSDTTQIPVAITNLVIK